MLEKIGYGILAASSRAPWRRRDRLRGGRRLVDETWLQVVPLAGRSSRSGSRRRSAAPEFIAAFVGGMVFGGLRRHRGGDVSYLIEQTGAVLGAVTFVVFGAILLGPAIGDATWQIALYAVLSLTLVRMVPVAIAMLGTGARRPTVAFLGWFGPRGAASIVFALLLLEDDALPHQDLILTTVFVTVGLSVLAHGASAPPSRPVRDWLDARSATETRPSRTRRGDVRWRLEREPEPREARLAGGSAPDRRARAAPRRLRDDRPRHGPPARLPADRPDLDRRAAAAARPLEPARAVRRRRARPPALGREEALRVERVHLADRVAPSIKARMRRRRPEVRVASAEGQEFLQTNAAFKRFVLRELERNGPMLSREIEGDAARTWTTHGWWGNRSVAVMLEILHGRGLVAVAGAGTASGCGISRERWYPEVETIPLREAERGSPSSASAPRASGSRGRAGRRIRTRRTARSPTASRSSPPSTGSSTTATAPRRSSTSATASRCTCRRRSASTATTSCRSSSATGSSAASSRASTGRRGRSRCSAPGETPPARTRRSRASPPCSAPKVARSWDEDPAAMHFETRAIHDGPGARPRDGRDHDADLPDLDVRAGGGRRPQGLRLRAGREPDADGAPGVHRLARGRRARRAFSSGLGAATTLMHLLSPGDHVVAVNDVYGGIYRMFTQVYEPKGYRFTFLTADEISTGLAEHLDERTKLVWLETPTNPALNIVDIARRPRPRTRSARSSSSTTRSRRRTSSSRSRSAPTSSSTRRRSTSAATRT